MFCVEVKPPFSSGGIPRNITQVDSIPDGSVNGFFGVSIRENGVVVGYNHYFIYDPYNDSIYVKTVLNNSNQNQVINYFLDSWAYKSFELTRNPVGSIADTSGLQSKILNALKLWLLIGLGVAAVILIVRYGYVFLLRFIFPLAIIGAIGRIGKNKDDS